MLPQVLTKSFLQENPEGAFKFIDWYNDNDKLTSTQIDIEVFFDLDFCIQLGYYLEWLADNGIYIITYRNPLRNATMLKIQYMVNPTIEFTYYDLEEVNVDLFRRNPLEAYEMLIAMFIQRLKYPF